MAGLPETLWRRTRAARAAIAAGAIAGLLVGGFGGRIVMRLVALMDPSRDGVLSAGGNTVGEITLGGSLELFIFGTVAGIGGGFAYILLRRWIPASGARRALLFGVGVVLVPGVTEVNEDSVDFQIFEPVLVSVALFDLLFLLYGLAVGQLADRFHPAPLASGGGRATTVVHGILAAIILVALIVNVVNVTRIVDSAGTCLSGRVGGGETCGILTTDVEDS